MDIRLWRLLTLLLASPRCHGLVQAASVPPSLLASAATAAKTAGATNEAAPLLNSINSGLSWLCERYHAAFRPTLEQALQLVQQLLDIRPGHSEQQYQAAWRELVGTAVNMLVSVVQGHPNPKKVGGQVDNWCMASASVRTCNLAQPCRYLYHVVGRLHALHALYTGIMVCI